MERTLVLARIERERAVIGHQIEATDRQLDRLVYEIRIAGRGWTFNDVVGVEAWKD